MNLSVQSHMMNKNTNYSLIQKTSFKGKNMPPNAFLSEQKIVEGIKNFPRKLFEEQDKFLQFCKSIRMTPKISEAISKRFAEIKQSKEFSDNALQGLIESNKRIVEGYKWLLNNGRKLSRIEIAQITEISLNSTLTQDIRNNANKLLEKNSKMKLGLY